MAGLDCLHMQAERSRSENDETMAICTIRDSLPHVTLRWKGICRNTSPSHWSDATFAGWSGRNTPPLCLCVEARAQSFDQMLRTIAAITKNYPELFDSWCMYIDFESWYSADALVLPSRCAEAV